MRFKFGVLKPGGLLLSVGAGAAAATFNNGDASPAGSVCGLAGSVCGTAENCCYGCKTAPSCCATALEIKVVS